MDRGHHHHHHMVMHQCMHASSVSHTVSYMHVVGVVVCSDTKKGCCCFKMHPCTSFGGGPPHVHGWMDAGWKGKDTTIH